MINYSAKKRNEAFFFSYEIEECNYNKIFVNSKRL